MNLDFDIAHAGFSVRQAGPDDAKAVRMLLPEITNSAVSFVAVDGRRQRIVGASTATRSIRQQPLVGPGISVHVIEPCRNCGIGGSLFEHLASATISAGAKALYAAKRVELNSDAMHNWENLGFVSCSTVQEHDLPLDQFEPRLAPLVARFQKQGKIPSDARIIPLYEANSDAVLKLHLDYMGGHPDDLRRKLRSEGPGSFHPRFSRVLMIGDQAKGCILAHRANKETASVDANILDPSVRGGWANIWLKLEATLGALSLGIENFKFTSFDHYSDTRSFTKKFGGVTRKISVLMVHPLGNKFDANDTSLN